MKLHDLNYDVEFEILREAMTKPFNGWSIDPQRKFRKGYKKYSKNPRFEKSFNALLKFIFDQSEKPQLSDFPIQYNVHPLNGKMGGLSSAHIVGTQIILVFAADYDKKLLTLIDLGDHSVYERYDPENAKAIMEKWYHGTPELNKFDGFKDKTINVEVIQDLDQYLKLSEEMTQYTSEDDKYFDILNKLVSLKKYVTIPAPIFLTDSRGVALSYADDKRAYDYQEAEPGVIEVEVKKSPDITIDAHGGTFRGISTKRLQGALKKNGLSEDTIDVIIRTTDRSGQIPDKVSTDGLAIIMHELGYVVADIKNVIDDYNAKGRPATVKMVMDRSLIVVKNIVHV